MSSLALSWTIVHPINDDSPLANLSKEQLLDSKLEVILNIKAFDDHFSNTVQQRTSFTYKQLIYGARFQPMFGRAADGEYTLLELDKIGAYTPAELPELVEA